MATINDKIEHIIVLMLENRSLDHMLGFLTHPDLKFQGLKGNESNPWYPGEPPVRVSDTSGYTLPVGPGHTFEDVIMQLFGKPPEAVQFGVDKPNNKGFVWNYELKGISEKKKRLGESFDNPDTERLEQALAEDKENVEEQPDLWLSDHLERTITVSDDGRVVFMDIDETEYELEAVSYEATLRWFEFLQRNQVEQIKEEGSKVTP